jgi:hypothetical protein
MSQSLRTGHIHPSERQYACERIPLVARNVVALLQTAFAIIREAEQQAKTGGLRADLLSDVSTLALLVNDARTGIVINLARPEKE